MTLLIGIILIPAILTALWYCGAVLFLSSGLRRLPPAGAYNDLHYSVIIAARNEAVNIAACLEALTVQTIGPDRFEVIIVNDRSTDDTGKIIDDYCRRYPHLQQLHITETPAGLSPKKYAVAQGVAAARYDIIVFTDADCIVPPAWLETIGRHFSAGVGLVQGITAYRQVEGMNRLFFRLQALDFLSHGVVAAAAIGADLPINSNANNFAFRREAFIEAGGVTESIGHIVSGDDDLLLQKIWKLGKWKIVYMTDPNGAVATQPTMTPGALLQQRARWGSKTVHYSPLQVLLLSGVFFFYLIIILSAAMSWADPRLLLITGGLFLVKYSGESLLMVPGLHRFGHTELLPLLPFASIIQLPVVITAVLLGIFGKFVWKDQSFSRTVRHNDKTHSARSSQSTAETP
ncbi:MAG: glycosyltransferase [Chitinispirillaceae bacterium]|nr:glycosyltransferase [Chitinispirillaceae bacterium]